MPCAFEGPLKEVEWWVMRLMRCGDGQCGRLGAKFQTLDPRCQRRKWLLLVI
jgi:hypothetical protein